MQQIIAPKTNYIYNDDCMNALKTYPANFFDCCVSDVPYKIKTGGARISEESIEKFGKTDPKGILTRTQIKFRIKSEKDLKNKWIKQNDNDNAILISKGNLFKHSDIKFEEWLPEVYRVLKNGSHCYLMVNSRNLKELQTKAENVGFKFLNLLVWVKNNATPNKYYMQQCEFILLLRKGVAKNINDMGMTNVFSIPNIMGNKLHPTEKPVELMRELIEQSTNEGDIVLEPFMGSGSTIIACKQVNRNYVGIEIDEQYFKVAQYRLSKIQGRLF